MAAAEELGRALLAAWCFYLLLNWLHFSWRAQPCGVAPPMSLPFPLELSRALLRRWTQRAPRVTGELAPQPSWSSSN
jgi:hypothetical protein